MILLFFRFKDATFELVHFLHPGSQFATAPPPKKKKWATQHPVCTGSFVIFVARPNNAKCSKRAILLMRPFCSILRYFGRARKIMKLRV